MRKKIEELVVLLVLGLMVVLVWAAVVRAEYTWDTMECGTTLKPADIIVYRPHVIQIAPGIKVPTEAFEGPRICNKKVQFHVDLYVGANWVMTSNPQKGCGAVSRLSDRIDSGAWSDIWIYRDESLTGEGREQILRIADSLECDYDTLGYYFWVIQMMLTCGEKRPLTDTWNAVQELLPIPPKYHCASFGFAPFEGKIKKPHSTAPDELESLGFTLISTCEIE